ncbi:hypothetical protein DPMN_032504 [Dreissena polymorpha]|uniref:Uncharacterized protein n=1 Tax=Dreissena polymorpha TaxID=45954 RepID=A0A9D4RI10_DREPO|nr:hypothetical protein DPMN_032504 [Dreissena polymorpha]
MRMSRGRRERVRGDFGKFIQLVGKSDAGIVFMYERDILKPCVKNTLSLQIKHIIFPDKLSDCYDACSDVIDTSD